MVNEQIRWGIMGCGYISGDYVEALKLLPSSDHKVVAIGSRDLERAKLFKQKHQLHEAEAYGSYEEFVNDPNIDIVYVGTRNNQHMDNVILCANAKKNILCEKPLGCCKEEVEKMFAEAKRNKVFLQEAFWSRFFPVYKEIQKVVKDGLIGEVKLIQTDLGFPLLDKIERLNKAELGGGILLDIGCYLIQFILHVFGKEAKVEKIFASGWSKYGVDDTTCIIIKFEGNKLASAFCTGTLLPKCSAEILGTLGRIEIPNDMHSPEKYTIVTKQNGVEEINEYCYKLPDADLKKFFFPTSNGLAFEAAGVRKHLMTGNIECCPEFTEEESLKVAEILDSIRAQL